jgi:hypothetical protein
MARELISMPAAATSPVGLELLSFPTPSVPAQRSLPRAAAAAWQLECLLSGIIRITCQAAPARCLFARCLRRAALSRKG